MNYKDLTILIAHPDDEVIFFWPLLKQAKKIICCSTDQNNPERQFCARRIEALMRVCGIIGAELKYLSYNSEFYRLPTRNGDLSRFVDEVYTLIINEKLILTHNSWGEYGHLDHILVGEIARMSRATVITTDIGIDANWFKVRPGQQRRGPIAEACLNDLEFYNKLKEEYDQIGCWTWSKDPVIQANLYYA